MAKFDQIANALSGFGAGIQGRGPEFIKGLADEKQRLSDDRKRAAAIDMYKAYNLLNSGNIDGAMKFGEERYNAIVQLGGDPSDTVEFMQQLSEDPSGQTALRDLKNGLKLASAQKYIDKEILPSSFFPQKLTDFQENIKGLSEEDQQTAIKVKAGLVPTAVAKKPLTPDQSRLQDRMPPGVTWENSTAAQRNQARIDDAAAKQREIVAPPELLAGFTPEESKIAKAAYRAGGGGTSGLEAMNSAVGSAREEAMFADIPSILDLRYPNASPAERQQLDSVVGTAKSTKMALESADTTREKQRTLKKGQSFQKRSVKLLKRILGAEKLAEVLGSVEGAYDIRLDDREATIIADIAELTSILTSDNLNLLKGTLSDTDIQLLKDMSAGALIRTREYDRFKEDGQELLDRLTSKMVTTVDDDDDSEDLLPGQQIMVDENGNRAIVDSTTNEVISELPRLEG